MATNDDVTRSAESENASAPRHAATVSSESWRNFREWVATALNVFLAPDGLVATDETIDTFAQVLECRVKEVNAELLAALKAVVPLAQSWLKHAPTHPDNGKIADALDAIANAEGR